VLAGHIADDVFHGITDRHRGDYDGWEASL